MPLDTSCTDDLISNVTCRRMTLEHGKLTRVEATSGAMRRPPILVTGMHRSGTSWVGRLLGKAPSVFYYQEPFSPLDRFGLQFGFLRAPYWYLHLCEDNEATYVPTLNRLVALKGAPGAFRASLRSSHSLRCYLSHWVRARCCWWRGGAALLKDPFALFSVERLVALYNMRVVVMIRHPAAFVSSVIKKGWHFDFRNWTRQKPLMKGLLREHANELERAVAEQPPLLEEASLMWRVCYDVVHAYRSNHPNWIVLRHEDLSRTPEEGFGAIFSQLDLEYSEYVRQQVRAQSSPNNPADADGVWRNSAANIWSWKRRLGDDAIAKIRTLTGGTWELFYSDADW